MQLILLFFFFLCRLYFIVSWWHVLWFWWKIIFLFIFFMYFVAFMIIRQHYNIIFSLEHLFLTFVCLARVLMLVLVLMTQMCQIMNSNLDSDLMKKASVKFPNPVPRGPTLVHILDISIIWHPFILILKQLLMNWGVKSSVFD